MKFFRITVLNGDKVVYFNIAEKTEKSARYVVDRDCEELGGYITNVARVTCEQWQEYRSKEGERSSLVA